MKQATEKTPTAPRRRRRWWVLLVALIALVWLLPGIAAHSPLWSLAIRRANQQFDGTLSVRAASLGWFSPIDLRGVELFDAEGKPVLSVETLTSERSLAGLLWDHVHLGRFRLQSPKLQLALDDRSSNVETMLAKNIAAGKPPQEKTLPTSWRAAVEVIDGAVALTDRRTGQTWQAKNVQASVELLDGDSAAKISADLTDPAGDGRLAAVVKTSDAGGELRLSAAGVPMGMFRAIASRWAADATLDGRLSAELNAGWGGQNRVEANLRIDNAALGARPLQSDVVRLERLHGALRASWNQDRFEIERSSLDCDLGDASLSGSGQWNRQEGLAWDSLLKQQCELRGRVDVARLARQLPATLRLRRDVEIHSGQAQLSFTSKPDPNGATWSGRIEAQRLTAVAQGRPIAWQQPMSLVWQAHQTPEGPFVDALRCESDFMKVHAQGTPDRLVASLTFNLQQLSDQLGQFVDLGQVQLSGEGWGNLNWTRSAERRFDADADLRLRNLQIALPGRTPWREDDLVAMVSAKGQTDFGLQTRIESGSLSMKTGDDRLDARLTEPVVDLTGGGTWPVRIEAQGQLRAWPGRLSAWLPAENCRLSGGYRAEIEGTASGQSIALRNLKLSAAPIISSSPWLNLNEPQLELTASGTWDAAGRRLEIAPASLTCATALVQADRLVAAVSDRGPLELAGTLKFQGDAARLRKWLSDPAKPASWQIAGQLGGSIHIEQTGDAIRGDALVEANNLAVVDASGQQFQEPSIKFSARANYDNRSGAIQIEKCEVASYALAANAAGRIAPVGGVNEAQIDAQIGYDLERLVGLLRPYLGPNVRIVGRGSTPAWYRGPFSAASGQAAGTVRWDRADLYGFAIGPAELKAAMADGVARIEPLDLSVSQGRLYLTPSVRLTAAPVALDLPKGPLAKQIQIDPRMCASMLKYIAPVLADVAVAQGAFSIDLEGCRVPLGQPAKGEVAGRLLIHSVEVGPGSLVRELAVLLGRAAPAKLRRESVVPFRMVGGRVYHENLELIFPEFTIRTKGSVGLDQSLDILAEMPVPPKWIEKNPMLSQAMRNQTIRLPIRGTLSKPQLDQKTLADLNRQFLQKAAGSLLENELNKQLDRLFQPKK